MKRRELLQATAGAFAVWAAPALRAQPRTLTDKISVLEIGGANSVVFLSGDTRVVVDSGPTVAAAAKTTVLFNTHYHTDQTGNNDRADAELQRMRETQAIERQFTDLHESAAEHPNDPEIRFRTGELARQLGKLKLAKIWFRAALAVDPKYTKARLAIDELDALPSKS